MKGAEQTWWAAIGVNRMTTWKLAAGAAPNRGIISVFVGYRAPGKTAAVLFTVTTLAGFWELRRNFIALLYRFRESLECAVLLCNNHGSSLH